MNRYRSIAAAIGILAILLSGFPVRWVQANGGDEGFEQEVNGYRVMLRFEGHAKTGENPVEVGISGPDGSPMSGLTVEVTTAAGAAHSDSETGAHEEDGDGQPVRGGAGDRAAGSPSPGRGGVEGTAARGPFDGGGRRRPAAGVPGEWGAGVYCDGPGAELDGPDRRAWAGGEPGGGVR